MSRPTKIVDGVQFDLTDEEIAAMEAEYDLRDQDLTLVRVERNGLLAVSDWTQLADAPLTDEKKAEWATYRQALRDYPAQSDRVSTLPAWPTPPS